MSDRASIDVTLGRQRGQRSPAGGNAVRILVLGGFSGRGEIGADTFTPRKVDFESVDQTSATLGPRILLDLAAPLAVNETLDITAMSDFHPDSLARRVSTFRTLALLGDRLSDPATQNAALAQLQELAGDAPASGQAPPVAAEQPANADDDMFERLLGAEVGAKSRAQEKVQSFIRNVMEDTPKETGSAVVEMGQQQLSALIEATMQAVLMTAELRDLERSWRNLDWLIRRLDGRDAEIYLVDLPKTALARHVDENAGALNRSELHRMLCEPATHDGWDIVIGDFEFALNVQDLALLATMGAVCDVSGAPFLAQGNLDLCGCESLDQIDKPEDWWLTNDDVGQLWIEVRSHAAAKSVGLAAPGMLFRQPYGADSDPIDAFDFEELPPKPDHERFFWGNPAFGCAYLIVQGRIAGGAEAHEIDDLPTVLYNDGTGQALKPPVEALLTDRAIEQIRASGLIAMVGHRNANTVRCPYLSTISMAQTEISA